MEEEYFTPGGKEDFVEVLIAERKDEAFFFYVIALENLLLGTKKDSEIGHRFRVRGAHLLGLGLKGRRIVLRDLRDFYTQRSQIVHSGSGRMTDSDMHLIQNFAKNAILYVLTDQQFASMKTEQELESWFDDRILR